MHAYTSRLTLTLLLLAGCGGKAGDDTDAGSSSAATDTTLGHSSTPTTDTPDPTSTTGSTSASATTAVEEPTTTTLEPNETGSSGDMPTICEIVCQLASACDLEDDPAACEILCRADLAAAGPACIKPTVVMLECFAGLECDHLELALVGNLDHPCAAEQLDRLEACDLEPDTCDTGSGSDRADACQLDLACAGQPPQRMECDAQQCICLEDGAQIGACAADGVCMALEQLGAKAESCCGFSGAP